MPEKLFSFFFLWGLKSYFEYKDAEMHNACICFFFISNEFSLCIFLLITGTNGNFWLHLKFKELFLFSQIRKVTCIKSTLTDVKRFVWKCESFHWKSLYPAIIGTMCIYVCWGVTNYCPCIVKYCIAKKIYILYLSAMLKIVFEFSPFHATGVCLDGACKIHC